MPESARIRIGLRQSGHKVEVRSPNSAWTVLLDPLRGTTGPAEVLRTYLLGTPNGWVNRQLPIDLDPEHATYLELSLITHISRTGAIVMEPPAGLYRRVRVTSNPRSPDYEPELYSWLWNALDDAGALPASAYS